MNRFMNAACAAAGLVVLACCESSPLTGPPVLKPGRDECAACGMLVSDQRCAGSLLVERDGRREHLIYDDIGCMLEAERDGASLGQVIERHVRDYSGDGWLEAGRAAFVRADPKAMPTPMGSGIVAFAGVELAKTEAGKRGGVVVEFAGLAGRGGVRPGDDSAVTQRAAESGR